MFELTGDTSPTRLTDIQSQSEWTTFFHTISRRRSAFAAIFVAFLVIVLLLTFLVPKSYTTDVKLLAGGAAGAGSAPGAETTLPILNALRLENSAQSAETYATLIVQPAIAKQVISDLKLQTTPDALLGKISVKPITNTSILDVSVTWRNPQTSAAIANQLATVFVAKERDLVSASAVSALGFVNQELPRAARKMHAAETALAQYEASHHIADINAQTQSMIATLSALDSKIAATQVDLRQNQAQFGSVNEQLAHVSETSNNGGSIAPNPVVGQLQSQLASVEVQLQSAQQQYTDRYPAVVALKNQQAHLQAQIARTPATVISTTSTSANPVYSALRQQASAARNAMASDQAQIATMQAQRSALEPELTKLPGQTNNLAELRSSATAAEDVFNALQKKANEATVARSSALSDITVVSAADPDAYGLKPNFKTNLLVGIVVGLALAVSGVFVLDFFDGSIKDDRDIAELALPILASVPRLEAKGKFSLPWVRSLTVEAFLQLVTSLRYASDTPIRTLTFTSPLQGDGKSTVAMNTAIAMSEISPRILLVDADLRRPSLHSKFEIRNEFGLSDLLVGNAKLENVVRTTRHAGLDIITSGMRTPNPYRLLQSERFDHFIEEALKVYRTVIIDGPALNPVIDGAVLCKKSDGTVLVVSAGQTDLRSTKKALARLNSVGVKDILGIVVNRTIPQRRDYYDSYLAAATPSFALPSET